MAHSARDWVSGGGCTRGDCVWAQGLCQEVASVSWASPVQGRAAHLHLAPCVTGSAAKTLSASLALPQVLCSASARICKHAPAALQQWVATPTSLLVQGAAIAYPCYPLSWNTGEGSAVWRRLGSSSFLKQKLPWLLANAAAQPDQGDPAGLAKWLCGASSGSQSSCAPPFAPGEQL